MPRPIHTIQDTYSPFLSAVELLNNATMEAPVSLADFEFTT